MKRLFLLLIVASLCLSAAAQLQTASATSVTKTYRQFDDEVKSGAYSNHYFGLNYKLPAGYVAQDSDTRQRILDAGHDSLKSDELKNIQPGPQTGFFMLMVATPPDQMVPQVSLMAQDVLMMPAVKSGADFLNMTTEFLEKQGFTRVKGPVPVSIGGKEFFRSDFSHPNGARQAMLSTIVRRHALAFVATAVNTEDLEQAVSSVMESTFSPVGETK